MTWTPLEADLLAATNELIDGYRVDDATWARLAEHLDERQLVEVVFVVGTYTCLAMAFNSFGSSSTPSCERSRLRLSLTRRTREMARIEKPPEGSWTAHYPELGTGPVSYEDSISPEIHELEREAIFKRSWLNVGRVEQLSGATLIVAAGFLDGDWRLAAWIVALAIDYAGPVVLGMGEGWRVAPEHFAERYGLVILIALGESIIAIGVGTEFQLHAAELLAAGLGAVLVSALWWLYFDVAAIFARRRLTELHGLDQAKLARDAYTYLHLPMIAGIVLFALGLRTTLRQVDSALDPVPAAALCGGTALYLLGHVGFLYRSIHRVFRRRTQGAIVLLVLIPVATVIPSLAALAVVSGICALVVAYEAIARREYRVQLRHPDGA